MSNKKTKTYIITVSKTFLKGHPRAGESTGFREAILNGTKIHTIRGNYEYWANIIDQVNAKEAILSIREWTGKPYGSKQETIRDLSWHDGIGYQDIFITQMHGLECSIEDEYQYIQSCGLVKNDGLGLLDFWSWFFPPRSQSYFRGIIIHFTPFRYK